MNLGLEELTDDQLVSLLQEVLQECSSRDPIIRTIVQNKINDDAAELKERRKLVKEAWNQARQVYLKNLPKEMKDAFLQKASSGAFPLVTPSEEAEVINGIARVAIAKAKEELKKRIAQDAQNELRSKVLSGEIEVFSAREKEVMVEEATKSAKLWMNKMGVVSLEQFAFARKQLYDNLLLMGHSREDVDKLYGKP